MVSSLVITKWTQYKVVIIVELVQHVVISGSPPASCPLLYDTMERTTLLRPIPVTMPPKEASPVEEFSAVGRHFVLSGEDVGNNATEALPGWRVNQRKHTAY